MDRRTNCKNCGAPLEYSEYGENTKCSYCGTEYHVNKYGYVEENIVELEIFGRKMKFYISSVTAEPIYMESTRLFDGSLSRVQSDPRISLELISF